MSQVQELLKGRELIVYRMYCEWDIGCNECIWLDPDKAWEDIVQAMEDCGIEDDIEELIDNGLVGLEGVVVI